MGIKAFKYIMLPLIVQLSVTKWNSVSRPIWACGPLQLKHHRAQAVSVQEGPPESWPPWKMSEWVTSSLWLISRKMQFGSGSIHEHARPEGSGFYPSVLLPVPMVSELGFPEPWRLKIWRVSWTSRIFLGPNFISEEMGSRRMTRVESLHT